jgi:hypothetical protein
MLSLIQQQVDYSENFDSAAFFRGVKGSSSTVVASNDSILNALTDFIRTQAKEVADKKNISLQDAYKLLTGVLDNYESVYLLPNLIYYLILSNLIYTQISIYFELFARYP